MPKGDRSPDTGIIREMTVAHIRARPEDPFVEVLFLESARIYQLPAAHPEFDRLLDLLRWAMATQRPVRIRLASTDSEIIQDARR